MNAYLCPTCGSSNRAHRNLVEYAECTDEFHGSVIQMEDRHVYCENCLGWMHPRGETNGCPSFWCIGCYASLYVDWVGIRRED